MKVTVNDEEMQIDDDTTVAALLASMGMPDRGVAVAVNAAVVPRSRWQTTLPAGACIDIVTAVQGG